MHSYIQVLLLNHIQQYQQQIITAPDRIVSLKMKEEKEENDLEGGGTKATTRSDPTRYIQTQGAVYSKKCCINALDVHNQVTADGICYECKNVVKEKDFITKLKQSLPGATPPLQHEFLLPEQKTSRLREQSATIYRLQGELDWSKHTHQRSMKRTKAALQGLKESGISGDITSILLDAKYLGAFGDPEECGKGLRLIKDMLHAMVHKDKKTSRGMRWSHETQMFFAALRLMGGPVCNYLLQDNLMAPGERTTRRVIKKFGVELHLGCSEDAIRHNVLQYKEVLIEAVQKVKFAAR